MSDDEREAFLCDLSEEIEKIHDAAPRRAGLWRLLREVAAEDRRRYRVGGEVEQETV